MDSVMVKTVGMFAPPAAFGLERLREALDSTGAPARQAPDIIAGLAHAPEIAALLARRGIQAPQGGEGVVISTAAQPVVLAGTDAAGLMYALCEAADRVRCGGLPALAGAGDEVGTPALELRIAGRFLTSQRDDEWYFSEEFWDYYTARLAMYRVNRLALITGFDTAWFSPPYPFLVQVPGYEDVMVNYGEDPQQRRRDTLAMLRHVGQKCHERGLSFSLGIWQQKPWTANQLSLIQNQPDDDHWEDYVGKALGELLRQCPEIDALSFRVNVESGMRRAGNASATDESFWFTVIDAVAGCGRPVKLELRAKGLTDTVLAHAQASGLDVSVPTKSWCEHIGLPYQMLQMREEELRDPENMNASRRYSYDDLLCKPRRVKLQYRLWNYGSTNILLWGDPEYARRFVKTCVADAVEGFEFAAPLSLKGGHAVLPGDAWPLHTSTTMRHYTFEDERYWLWYLVFGRLGYNPDAPPDIWQREFCRRFGAAADAMERAALAASRVLPLVTTAHFPEHPSMHYWPELYAGAALFPQNNYEPYFTAAKGPLRTDRSYGSSLPSDEALFCSIDAYADAVAKGAPPRCISPLQVRDWYHALAQEVFAALSELERGGEGQKAAEIASSAVDFKILAHIGVFHAWMVGAAYHLALFRQGQGREQLAEAWRQMQAARVAWARLSELGDAHYAHDLVFDVGSSTRRNGNWRSWLENQVDPDLRSLAALLRENGLDPDEIEAAAEFQSLRAPSPLFTAEFAAVVPQSWPAGRDMPVRLLPGSISGLRAGRPPRVHYRRNNLRDGLFSEVEMARSGEGFGAVIPGAAITADYDLYVYFALEDAAGNVFIHPGLYSPASNTPVYLVRSE